MNRYEAHFWDAIRTHWKRYLVEFSEVLIQIETELYLHKRVMELVFALGRQQQMTEIEKYDYHILLILRQMKSTLLVAYEWMSSSEYQIKIHFCVRKLMT